MKKLLLFSSFLFSVSLSTVAQTLPLANGFYRVQNYKTERYAYVTDNTGSVNTAAATAEVGALELWKGLDRTISDPASVMYAQHKTTSSTGATMYDVHGQGTSIYGLLKYYVSIYQIPKKNQYNLYATISGITKYLDDDETYLPEEEGAMGFNRTGDFRKWNLIPIDAATDNYFGISPSVTAGGKYYQPFYADFSFDFASKGMKAYYVQQYDATKKTATLVELTGKVPASMPVIIECSSKDPSNNRMNLYKNTDKPKTDNILAGVYFNNDHRPKSQDARKKYDSKTMRVLGVNSAGKLVFKTSSQTYLEANQSYLVVPSTAPAEIATTIVSEADLPKVKVTSITLNASTSTLTVGESTTLVATVAPTNADDPSVTWKSSNTSVATVDNGVVKALSAGQATITVTANDGSGKSAKCVVTVKAPVVLVTGVTLDQTEKIITAGGSLQLNATVTPANATNSSLDWSSSNTSVATVKNGLVTAVKAGEAVITAKAKDASGVSATCKITVNPVLVNAIKLNSNEITLVAGQTSQLTATVSPTNAADKTVSWSSSDASVASVKDGKITAVSAGEAIITVKANDGSGVTASCKVIVTPVVLVSNIVLNLETVTLVIGESSQLSATVSPDNATNSAITWTSSDSKVATVQNGKITAVAVGEATITVKAQDASGASASCKVVVNPILVNGIVLNKQTLTLLEGKTSQLSATVTPANANDKSLVWISSNPTVATVKDGLVTAVSAGEATITATAKDGSEVSASCQVTVDPVVSVSGIALNEETLTLTLGETGQLTATVSPANATNSSIVWTSSNAKVATVQNGKVTAVAVGEAIITVKAQDASGISATCKVVVNPILVNGIVLNKQTLTLLEGKTSQLSATVAPANANDKSLVWISSNPTVATVKDGLVTAVSAGEATITATAKDGSEVSASCQVTVDPVVLVSGITLNEETLTLTLGESGQLTATVSPANATNSSIVWTSSNAKVATVQNGKVTAVAVGEAIITVKAQDASGVSATCKVVVNPILVNGIVLNKQTLTLLEGKTSQLSATVTPANANDKSLVWISSNPSVATVKDGLVTAVSAGEATITASALDGSDVSASCQVTVNAIVLVSDITLSEEVLTLTLGETGQLTATVSPANAANSSIVWTSSNAKVATVQNGKITAVAVGEAIITVKAQDASGVSATCKVIVNPIFVNSITLDKQSLTLLEGKTAKLSASVAPDDATDSSIVWKSSNTSVAVVKDGVVTAVGAGKATITVTANDGSGVSASCQVTVNPLILVSGIALDSESLTLTIGETSQLTVTVSPEDALDPSVSWSSSNTKVVTVKDGKITALAVGEAVVTVTANDASGLSASCKVTVSPILVNEITLSTKTITLIEGNSFTLSASVSPSNATDASLEWSSSDTKVATVKDGVVTAVAAGEVIIMVTAKDGSVVSASCKVTVKSPAPVIVNVYEIALSSEHLTLFEGETAELSASVSPSNATDATVSWRSSDTKVATVKDGKVTAVAAGEVIITVTANDGSGVSATCKVTVNPVVILVAQVTLDQTEVELTEGETLQINATVAPKDATDPTLIWDSSDPAIVTVVDGKITAIAVGIATITAQANDAGGVLAECTVIVKAAAGIEQITADGTVARVPVYSLSGAKVLNAGESLDRLPASLYVINGKVVNLVK